MDPIVRYMILCEDWETDRRNPLRLNVYGLLSNITSLDDPPYPLTYRELCVLLVVAGGRRSGHAEIACIHADSGQRIFATPPREVRFSDDPLAVVAIAFRIRNCRFPEAGLYAIEFWYNNNKVDERPLLLR